MEINEKTVDAWISYWKDYIGEYSLPSWDQIPDFGLYMEQAVTFLRNCFSYMDSDDNPVITASAINNYVRKKYIPQPEKKRYYRRHLAYLIILCALKQSLSIAEIQTLLPMEIDDKLLSKTYDSFTLQHKRAAEYFIGRMETIKEMIMSDRGLESIFKDNATDIVVDVALIASYAKILSEKLVSGAPVVPEAAEED